MILVGESDGRHTRITLREVLDLAANTSGVAFDVNKRPFESEMVNDVLGIQVADPTALRLPQGATLRSVLDTLLRRIPTTSGAAVVPRKHGKEYLLEVTTGAYAVAEQRVLLHPVGDLLAGKDATTSGKLITHLRGVVPGPRDRFRVEYLSTGRVLSVTAEWRLQEEVAAALDRLREARRVGR
jgi:hypothetical protein